MNRYFSATGKQHTPASFRTALLLNDRILIQRHLENFGPGEFQMEETILTDRYMVEAFLRKKEYGGRSWEEITQEEYKVLDEGWRLSYPLLPEPAIKKPARVAKKV
jgi:hypothetical protein